jgi:hypothetical protein
MLASWPRVRQGDRPCPGIGLESDVPGGHKTIVEINIDAIGAWRHLLAFFKSRQVSHRRRIVS